MTAANTRRPSAVARTSTLRRSVGLREPLGEAGPLEPVDEPGGVGGPVQQAVGDGADRHAGVGVVGQAQRPQRHVLRVGDPLGAADLLELIEVAVGQQQHVEVHVAPHPDSPWLANSLRF